jgi:putative ABC transport system substrate-binding protein
LGFVEGRHFAIEFRGTDRYDDLPRLATELVQRRVSVIFTAINANAALAAKAATTTLPIVFTTGADPVRLGLVSSMNRPDGNVTGITFYANALAPKRLELLRELIPSASTIAFLVNPINFVTRWDTDDMQTAALAAKQELLVVRAGTPDEIDVAFADARRKAQALLVNPDSFFGSRRVQMIVLAASLGIPSSYFLRDFVAGGGLMSYGDSRANSVRQAATYVGRILKGEKVADLPVLQPTKFELVINLRTAKALGIVVPTALLARADEVIE